MITNFDITVTLSPDEIRKAILRYVLSQMMECYEGNIENVTIKINQDDGEHGNYIYTIGDAKVKLSPQNKAKYHDDNPPG